MEVGGIAELPEDIKVLVDGFIEKELSKITTDGKLDREKAIRYLVECMERDFKNKSMNYGSKYTDVMDGGDGDG